MDVSSSHGHTLHGGIEIKNKTSRENVQLIIKQKCEDIAIHRSRRLKRGYVSVRLPVLLVLILKLVSDLTILKSADPVFQVKSMLNTVLLIFLKFPIIITRSNNIYGPRQFTEKVQNPNRQLLVI